MYLFWVILLLRVELSVMMASAMLAKLPPLG
jgi:hypothetical protein